MYETWFRLSKRPFSAPPQTVNYFPNDGLETASEGITRCVQRNAGPGVVIGEHGTGKSMLSMMVMNHFQADRSMAQISAPGVRTRKELIQTMLFELGLPYVAADEGELRLSLVDYLTSLRAGQQGTLLVVDDAHDLPLELLEQLASLSGLVRDGRWCVDLVMLGTSALEEKLAMPALASLNQRIAARYYLRPWTFPITLDYLRHQISLAGGELSRIFEESAIRRIHKLSGGIPRVINQLCDHTLVLAATGNVSAINEAMIDEAWSDLQNLPKDNANSTIASPTMNDDPVVEFGSLDDDAPIQWQLEQDLLPPQQASDQQSQSEELPDNASSQAWDRLPVDQEYSENPRAKANTNPSPERHESPIETWKRIFDTPVFVGNDYLEEPNQSKVNWAIQDPADKILDEIERQLLEANSDLGRLSTQHGIPNVTTNREAEDRSTRPTNPFCESFVDEEVVIGRGDLKNHDWMKLQQSVATPRGAELVQTLRRLEVEDGFCETFGYEPTDFEDPFGFSAGLRGEYHSHPIHIEPEVGSIRVPHSVSADETLTDLRYGYATGDLERPSDNKHRDKAQLNESFEVRTDYRPVLTDITTEDSYTPFGDSNPLAPECRPHELQIPSVVAADLATTSTRDANRAANDGVVQPNLPPSPVNVNTKAKTNSEDPDVSATRPDHQRRSASQPQRKFSRLFSSLKQP